MVTVKNESYSKTSVAYIPKQHFSLQVLGLLLSQFLMRGMSPVCLHSPTTTNTQVKLLQTLFNSI